MNESTAALQLDRVCKSFAGTTAVDELSLTVHPGEMVGFLGPNGAGKSTTLYMVTGLVRPSAGRIEVFGHDIQKQFTQAMTHIGAMIETPTFYANLSGRKNLELLARVRKSGPDQIDKVLQKTGLHQRQHDRTAAYSQGMKQRLALAAALLGTPRLLLLDEPTNGLDPEARREIMDFIRNRTAGEGLAVFLSSHLRAEVEDYCDRVVIMNRGRLVCSGNVEDILTPHGHIIHVTFSGNPPDRGTFEHEPGIARATRLGPNSWEIDLADRDAAWLNHFLWSKGRQVSELRPKVRTLKEFFLAKTEENGP